MDPLVTTTVLGDKTDPETLGGEHLIRAVLSLESRIVGAIESGAQWEIWLQVELMAALRNRYGINGREWTLPGTSESVDLAFTYKGRYYFVEIKVESAHNAGQFAGKTCEKAVEADLEKLGRISLSGTEGSIAMRAVLVVGWSPSGSRGYETAAANYTFHMQVPGHRIFAAVFFVDSEL